MSERHEEYILYNGSSPAVRAVAVDRDHWSCAIAMLRDLQEHVGVDCEDLIAELMTRARIVAENTNSRDQ